MTTPSKNKQIVFVRYWGSFFKSPRIAHEYATLFRPLVERGWKSYLMLEHKPENPAWIDGLNDLGVQIICMPRPRAKIDVALIKQIYCLCRDLKCDIFHCDNMHTNQLIAACLSRVPVRIWVKRAMNSHFEECRKPSLYERCAITTRLSCGLATRVIAISHTVKNELLDLGVAERKILVQSNPSKHLIKQSTIREEVRRSLGYSESDIVIATLGHAVPVKGWDLLLQAFSRISIEETRARLLMIGSTNANSEKYFFKELMKFIDVHELKERVFFPGHAFNVSAMLAAADLFVFPSRSEGGGNALLEALELGLPCISTRVGYAEEVIQDGINGLLVNRNDPSALESAMKTLIRDKEMRSRFAAEAKVPPFILNLEEYSERFASIYDSLLKESNG